MTECTDFGKKTRPSCRFGDTCIKVEYGHRDQFSHPGDEDYDPSSLVGAPRPSCRFGTACRNTTEQHWKLFAHPGNDDWVEHVPKDDGVKDDALRFEGEISHYTAKGDWGFIRCTALSGMLGMNEAEGKPKDLYFTKKNANAKQLSVGQQVTFVLKEQNNNGKPEAVRVELMMPGEDAPDAVRYHGIVSSFIDDATWGFITCPLCKTGQDIWFHLKDCGGNRIWKGMTVSFLLDEVRRPGQPEAISVRPGASSEDPEGFNRITGEVTKLLDTSGIPFGFIRGEENDKMDDNLRDLVNNKDFYFNQRDCTGRGKIFEGAKVTFLVDQRSQQSSKPLAIRVKMVDPDARPPGWKEPAGWQQDQSWSEGSWNEGPDPMEMMATMMGMFMKGKAKGCFEKGDKGCGEKGYDKGYGDKGYDKGYGDKGFGKGYDKGKGKKGDWGESGWSGKGKGDDAWWEAGETWQPPKPPSNVPPGIAKLARLHPYEKVGKGS